MNADIGKQIKKQSIQNKIDQYRQNGISYLKRMTDEIIPRQVLLKDAETWSDLEKYGMNMLNLKRLDCLYHEVKKKLYTAGFRLFC
jgi:hypothetical protein